jgi:hypothetical protein
MMRENHGADLIIIFKCYQHARIIRLFVNVVLTLVYLGVLEQIHKKWDMMTKEECLPVHVALQLMDHSSLGRGDDYQDFQATSHELQKALKAIVNGISPKTTSQDYHTKYGQNITRGLTALSVHSIKSNLAYKHRRIAFDP